MYRIRVFKCLILFQCFEKVYPPFWVKVLQITGFQLTLNNDANLLYGRGIAADLHNIYSPFPFLYTRALWHACVFQYNLKNAWQQQYDPCYYGIYLTINVPTKTVTTPIKQPTFYFVISVEMRYISFSWIINQTFNNFVSSFSTLSVSTNPNHTCTNFG